MKHSSFRVRWIMRVFVACVAVAATAIPLRGVAAGTGSAKAVVGETAQPTGGTQVWVARDAGPNNAYDSIGGMVTSPDGSTVYVAKSSGGDFVVVAHNAIDGSPRWRVRTPSPDGAQLFAHAVAISPDGRRLFVTGEAEPNVGTRTVFTVAYDIPSKSVLWTARLSAGANRMAIPRRIAVGPDGTDVFVAGSKTGRHGGGDFWDYFTVGYSAASGVRLWGASYNGPADRGDTAEGLGVSPDGSRVFVTGTSASSGDARDFATIAYSAATGSREWVARYVRGVDNFASDLLVSPDGSRVYAVGFGRPSLRLPHGFRLVAYDAATGNAAGVAGYDDGGDDLASDAAISNDGSRVFVTGSGGGDFVTVAFETSKIGRPPLWAARYNGGNGMDNGYGVAVSPDGTRVYVTGESDRGRVACFGDVRSTAYATVGLDAATGSRGWVARYAGLKKDPDQAAEVAVSPDGALVFVTGNSDFACVSSDVATLAYQS